MSDANWVDGTASLYSSRGQGHVVAPLLAPDADVTENEKSQLKAQLGNIDLDSFLKLHAASTQPCHDENGDDDLIESGVGVDFFGFFFSGSCSVSDSTFSPLIARSMCRIAFVRS